MNAMDAEPPAAAAILPISADSHILEPPNCYLDYIEPAFRDRAPRIGKMTNGKDAFFVEGFKKPISLGMSAAAGADLRKMSKGADFDEVPRGAWDAKARIADQDRDGVGAELIYPSVGMVICNHPDHEFKKACMWAYNRWLLDFVSDAPDRVYGLGQLAVGSVEQAIEDLFRLKDMGFKGVMMPGEPDTGVDYCDPAFDPFWSAAEEAGMPLSWHVLTGGLTRSYVDDPLAQQPTVRYPVANATFEVLRMCQDLMGMLVLSRVFENHPKLKVVCVEADAGWVPHFIGRLDHNYERHRVWKDDVELKRMPSEYFLENIYLTFQNDASAFEAAHLMNPDRLLWASDFPHSDSTWPHSQEVIATMTQAVSEDLKAKVLRDNVAALYNIPAPVRSA